MIPPLVRIGAAALAAALAGGAVRAAPQADSPQVITTAPADGGVPNETPDPGVVQTESAQSGEAPQDQDTPKRSNVSGEISVSAGSGGYREVDGEATAPIGDSGEATIAIDASQIGGRR